MISEILKNGKMILSLAKSDFKKRFVGSYFGIVWMFIQPLATILVYTLIFQVGFRATPPIANVPYVLWLIPAIVPWFYFQEALIQGTQVLYEYSFLVKKVIFNVATLPLVKLISSLLSHIIFVTIMIVVFLIARVPLTINVLSIIYFSFALSVLILGLIYLTSAINVFFKDMSQIVTILLQFGIWMAPIMYDESLFINRSTLVYNLLKFNPIYYIVKGYRFAMLSDSFDNFINLTIYFWIVALLILFLGYRLFNKLKPHFSDVL